MEWETELEHYVTDGEDEADEAEAAGGCRQDGGEESTNDADEAAAVTIGLAT